LDFKIDPGTKLTPEVIKKLYSTFEIKITEKEINVLDEWIILITEVFEKASRGGATTPSLINAFRNILERMEQRKKICYRDKSDWKKIY
jgi:hypothetical protein